MNLKKLLSPEEIKTATCRWCGSEYEFTVSNKPELPWCWNCTAAALEKFERGLPRRPVKRRTFFTKL